MWVLISLLSTNLPSPKDKISKDGRIEWPAGLGEHGSADLAGGLSLSVSVPEPFSRSNAYFSPTLSFFGSQGICGHFHQQ